MAKLIPLSMILMTLVLPIVFSERPRPHRSVRVLQAVMLAFVLVWGILCITVYPQYVKVE
jgi:hypothetical protein